MAEQCYGGNKISYVVTQRSSKDGIEVFVFHQNAKIRNIISQHIDDPTYFLDNLNPESSIMAEKWLARLVRDYQSKFEQGLVEFKLIQFA